MIRSFAACAGLMAMLLGVVMVDAKHLLAAEPFQPPETKPARGPQEYLVGAGIADITGPAAENRMMGYAKTDQITAGIHLRLWSRAFVVAAPEEGRRVVFVAADLGQMFQSVKQGVVKKLQANKKLQGLYHDQNVMLTATHTHGGPGGYSHYALPNVTTLGFQKDNYDKIVHGVYLSVVRAHENLQPGIIQMARGKLLDASKNRSIRAYLQNPREERDKYSEDRDTEMTLLRFAGKDGRELGSLNWFAVHTTSMTNTNRLITGDNKGYAAHLVERAKGADYTDKTTYVAGFAQAAAGDVSPNVRVPAKGETRAGGEFNATARSAIKQSGKALELLALLAKENAEGNAKENDLNGPVDWRHQYVDFSKLRVEAKYTGGTDQTLAPAALGVSFAAGAEDGPSGLGIKEGVTWKMIEDGEKIDYEVSELNPLNTILKGLIHSQPRSVPGQGEKPVIAEPGKMGPPPWSPQILPLQVLRIGGLAIVGMPGEPTTMTGRRIRQTVLQQLKPSGVEHVVVAGMANSYAGYFATREEYAAQHYEGASTHFGPWTEAGCRQQFDKLAMAMRCGKTDIDNGTQPLDLSDKQTASLQTGVVLDAPLLGYRFGQAERDTTKAVFAIGETVTVSFSGAHPKNAVRSWEKPISSKSLSQRSFLRVEKGPRWTPVAHDWDWETKFIWARIGVVKELSPASRVTVQWTIPKGATPGLYRIATQGFCKPDLKNLKYYRGVSSPFYVAKKKTTKLTLKNGTKQELVVHYFKGNDRVRLVAESERKLKAGKSLTFRNARYHIRVFEKSPLPQIGRVIVPGKFAVQKLNITSPVATISKSGRKFIVREK